MKHILLLGAGFSRNWGGWLAAEVVEFLLGHKEIVSRPELRRRLLSDRTKGGFETTLAELQAGNAKHLTSQDTIALEKAVSDMFHEMNVGLLNQTTINFSNNQRGATLSEFMAKFDAIFTLNQDLLLEKLYLNLNVDVDSGHKWSGAAMPGVRLKPGSSELVSKKVRDVAWLIADSFKLESKTQPYIKLHGSSNWKCEDGRDALIIGGGKSRVIETFPLLKAYHETFRSFLNENASRLMVIGYGFGDDHINEAMRDAAGNGLRLFVVDPNGVDVLNNTNEAITTQQPDDLEEILIGASRRSLAETFVHDRVEHGKLMRFFDQ